ncbi:MAG TPA: VOC family protein [Solirubrobacteraceae bacterium]|nr:VOC family protein [Solirubrobacteraceae bacterium]
MADAIPKGYRTVTPYLSVDDARAAIDFYARAFGAEEFEKMEAPNGAIAHASVKIGDSLVMLSDPFPMSNAKPPKEIGGTSVVIFLYVEDVDAAFQRAVDAGATATVPPEDMFWGDRFAQVGDPFGHYWQIATHVEDVSEEEIAERAKQAMSEMGMG